MKFSTKSIFFAITFLTVSLVGNFITGMDLFATSNLPKWNDIAENKFIVKGEKKIIPEKYRTLKLDFTQMQSVLRSVPAELSERAKISPVIIELPLPGGGLSKFYVTEYSMMEQGLAVKFPDYKTYNIKGIDDPYASGKIDITMKGFHAMVLSARGNYYIDPYSENEKEIYISYYKSDMTLQQSFECFTEQDFNQQELKLDGDITTGPQLRTYRLAMAATGEYTAFHGGTVATGMAAIVTAMNRINGVYEKDLAVRMVLVSNNDTIVYTNAATDPYTNSNGGAMLSQNQSNLDAVIQDANYDMGHVFSTGGGGVANLSCVCVSNQKARGVTGLPSPTGDPFYIDFVAHEMGHQFGGNHSFNSISGGCGGGNRNNATAWEPGSGSTIMAYAGLCGADNLQNFSDDFFHTGNFTEMATFTQSGSACPVIIMTGNTPPVVTVPTGQFTIPMSTPFQLTGSAIDFQDQQSLTYCWEELDLGPAGSPNNPMGTAPIFRSFKPDTNATRWFPKLSNLLNNTQQIGERLPTYERSLNFRLTVRDNHVGGGGVDYSFIEFFVASSAGPFLVSQPNTNVTWNSNVPQLVTWDVASTSSAPVSCALVNIKLSTDGGLTFGTTLASNTVNDGSESVMLPSIINTTARIKVESVGNIFFDISNVNFTITNVVGVAQNGSIIPESYSLSQNFPNPFNPATRINFDVPFSSHITLNIMDIAGREVATIINNSYEPGSYTATFEPGSLASGIYFYRIFAVGDNGNYVMTKKMTLIK